MNKDESKALGAVAGIGAIIVVSGVISYARTVRTERKKRKQIREWRDTTLSAIRASKERLDRLAADPDVTLMELMQAWREENEFIRLIENQPMY